MLTMTGLGSRPGSTVASVADAAFWTQTRSDAPKTTTRGDLNIGRLRFDVIERRGRQAALLAFTFARVTVSHQSSQSTGEPPLYVRLIFGTGKMCGCLASSSIRHGRRDWARGCALVRDPCAPFGPQMTGAVTRSLLEGRRELTLRCLKAAVTAYRV